MKDLHLEALIRLYLLGKNIKSLVKRHNHDQINLAFVLWQLQKESLSISELAKLSGIKPSAMSEKIRSMKHEKLIQEIKTNDKRKKSFFLTTKGLKRWNELKNKISSKSKQHCLGLSLDDTQKLLSILGKINLESA